MNLSGRIKSYGNLLHKSFKKFSPTPNRRKFSQTLNRFSQNEASTKNVPSVSVCDKNIFDFQENWPIDIKNEFIRDMIVIDNFITESEEERLLAEAEKSLKRMRYEYDHWDNAIHGFREMEKINWLPENQELFDRVRKRAFVSDVLPHVHILDLAKDGIIKPHVDSSRYCGSTIAGLSLLTNCIMRLKRVDETQYWQEKEGEAEAGKNVSKQQLDKKLPTLEFDYYVDALLQRRSLYIMKDSARYKFTHEVLAAGSIFKENVVHKGRRISIICRNQA